MTDIVVRPTDLTDIPSLIKLRWDVCVEQGAADPADERSYRRYSQALRAFLERNLLEEQCQIIVASGGDEIVGTSTLWLFPILPWPGGLNEWHGYVTNVYVIPSHRRQGIARRLMEALKQVAQQHGASALLLEASPDSARLYQQMGFTPG
ncbi:MAG: GNAT family N-acetyltransferase, partial [Chloroflexi bacterium]|nr:GNAT family N-acetyltransferase [Chloroflexota bacterium]